MDALVQTNKVSRTEHRNYKLHNRGKKSVTETRFSLKNYKTLKIVIKLLRKQNWGHVK